MYFITQVNLSTKGGSIYKWPTHITRQWRSILCNKNPSKFITKFIEEIVSIAHFVQCSRKSTIRKNNFKNIFSSLGTTMQNNYTEQKVSEEPNYIYEPFIIKVLGRDGAQYSLEVFMRDVLTCSNKRNVASKEDDRAPVIADGRKNYVIVPHNHKVMLYAKRKAINATQVLEKKKWVLFKFYVDGTALSDGILQKSSKKNPDTHWAKVHIGTSNLVGDDKTVENYNDANPKLGTIKIEIWTNLRRTKVVDQYRAVPEDDRTYEKRKQKICFAHTAEQKEYALIVEKTNGTVVRKNVMDFKKHAVGFIGRGPPQATINCNYDNLQGMQQRHQGEPQFTVDQLMRAGVTSTMFRQAYPDSRKKNVEVIIIDD